MCGLFYCVETKGHCILVQLFENLRAGGGNMCCLLRFAVLLCCMILQQTLFLFRLVFSSQWCCSIVLRGTCPLRTVSCFITFFVLIFMYTVFFLFYFCFFAQGVGTVVAGTTLCGVIRANDTLLLGPDPLGRFLPCTIKSIHRKRMPVTEVRGGQTATFALKKVS